MNTGVPGSHTQLHGPSRMLTSSRNAMDQRCSYELPKTAMFASLSHKYIPERPRTYTDRRGATRFTCLIMPTFVCF
ncbi:hypothetical protein DPMN_026778 [Dreissena polymorpha]|uniref:Uncharacterized protein n=1 Tax=Dreissena polymorpha TaxID=45954 RepID=A0A9D4LU26_DREPO|nr:hypothetical protein DPMN_026778 [Dreissena polymorpha]